MDKMGQIGRSVRQVATLSGATRRSATLRDMCAGMALAGLLASAGAEAMQGGGGQNSQSQAYFVCPNGGYCDPYQAAFGPTPIDDIKLGGGYWDVTWSQTAPATSPFVLSTTTAKPGQPLTGIDAANALVAFYDEIPPPVNYCCADNGYQAITAFSPGAASGLAGLAPTTPGDVAEPFPGYGAIALYAPNLRNQISFIGGTNGGYAGEYTIWTPVAAPTHVPELDTSGLSGAATLLLGALAVVRGRHR